ncbi:hypothetical protein [Chamaesiphon sp.]|uniref:hypothetical protein n=1 Tax=Chamaesiphon sp. TaxID=2814140 RepID=UPI003593DB2A
MSQTIQFQKLKVFKEEITPHFPSENIYESLILLLRGTEKNYDEYIDLCFQGIGSSYLEIDILEIEAFVPGFYNDLKYPIFDPKKITFFMLDENIWNAVQLVIEKRIKTYLDAELEVKEKLVKIIETSKDYKILLSLFEEKLLFATIF